MSKWARSIVGHRLAGCLVPNKDRELSQASVFSQGGGGVGGALLCLLRDHDQLSAHDQLSTHPKRGLGKFSLSRLHFFDSGCTFCSKLKKKKLEKFLQRNWVDYGHTHHSWIRNGLAGVLPPALVFQVHLAHLVGQLASHLVPGHVVPGHLVPGQGGLLDPGALVWQGGGGHPVRTTSSRGLSPGSVNLALNMLNIGLIMISKRKRVNISYFLYTLFSSSPTVI